MSKFNHKYGNLHEAMNISDERMAEIKTIIFDILVDSKLKSKSECLEALMQKEFGFEEGIFVGYIFGSLYSEKLNAFTSISVNTDSNPLLSFLLKDTDVDMNRVVRRVLDKQFSEVNVNLKTHQDL